MIDAHIVSGMVVGKSADECRDLRLKLWRCGQLAGCCVLAAYTVPLLLVWPMALIRSIRQGHVAELVVGGILLCAAVAAMWKAMEACNISNSTADDTDTGTQELVGKESMSESSSYRPPACGELQP
mmetsp:Transcript_27733/g.50675  ORF Transcript_27733/g.50675 Transcript_27733/m.50675 type:complete len:126 (+) Transcript_27733:40-417(+)